MAQATIQEAPPMRPLPTPRPRPKRAWPALAAYYRQCLEHEQMQRLQVSLEQQGYALLRGLDDQLITRGAPEALLSAPPHLQQVRQLIARESKEDQALYYGFPLVAQQKSLIPVCYTQVRAEPGPTPGTVLLRREGELLPNRRFLMEVGDLTDAEVAEFARRIAATKGPNHTQLAELLGDGVITPDGLLFRADPDLMTRGLLRELQWLERQTRLSAPLTAYISDDAPTPAVAPTPGVTVVRSNPAQDKVLRFRSSTLQTVAGVGEPSTTSSMPSARSSSSPASCAWATRKSARPAPTTSARC